MRRVILAALIAAFVLVGCGGSVAVGVGLGRKARASGSNQAGATAAATAVKTTEPARTNAAAVSASQARRCGR